MQWYQVRHSFFLSNCFNPINISGLKQWVWVRALNGPVCRVSSVWQSRNVLMFFIHSVLKLRDWTKCPEAHWPSQLNKWPTFSARPLQWLNNNWKLPGTLHWKFNECLKGFKGVVSPELKQCENIHFNAGCVWSISPDVSPLPSVVCPAELDTDQHKSAAVSAEGDPRQI